MITKLFTPMKVGNCTIPNRLVVPAMVTNYCDEDGFLTDRYMAYIEEKAKGVTLLRMSARKAKRKSRR